MSERVRLETELEDAEADEADAAQRVSLLEDELDHLEDNEKSEG